MWKRKSVGGSSESYSPMTSVVSKIEQLTPAATRSSTASTEMTRPTGPTPSILERLSMIVRERRSENTKYAVGYIPYQTEKTLQERQQEYQRLVRKYQHTKIPIVCEPHRGCPMLSTYQKMLVPSSVSLDQILVRIRMNLKLDEHVSLVLFVATPSGKYMVPSLSKTMEELYNLYRDEDGFLYFIYSFENTFGGEHLR